MFSFWHIFCVIFTSTYTRVSNLGHKNHSKFPLRLIRRVDLYASINGSHFIIVPLQKSCHIHGSHFYNKSLLLLVFPLIITLYVNMPKISFVKPPSSTQFQKSDHQPFQDSFSFTIINTQKVLIMSKTKLKLSSVLIGPEQHLFQMRIFLNWFFVLTFVAGFSEFYFSIDFEIEIWKEPTDQKMITGGA